MKQIFTWTARAITASIWVAPRRFNLGENFVLQTKSKGLIIVWDALAWHWLV